MSSTQHAEALAAAYATDAPSIDLGVALIDGEPTGAKVQVPLSVCNRHGLIAGATGTGKTKTLQGMAEQFSAAGVPVFLADYKGDLSGLATRGEPHPKIDERAEVTGQNWQPMAFPVEFFSLGGRGEGVPIRATVTSFGPDLLAKVLDLSEVQTSSLKLIFHYADNAGLALVDLKDLRAVVHHLSTAEGKDDLAELGGISKATIGVILRELTAFEHDGASDFFGEPQFETEDLLRTDDSGQGIISCLQLAEVSREPALFSSFLMWLLADLFDILPEVGDPQKPKLVFFFDEAHLLFKDAPKHLVEQIEHTVRLIRSKGVGIFFVTQHPTDLPEAVLAQLGSRVQHALRAFTPSDATALKKTATTYPVSDIYDTETLLSSVGIGEAVVTVLTAKGSPTPVVWTMLPAPQSLMAPTPPAMIAEAVKNSALMERYGTVVDGESADELLAKRTEQPDAGSEDHTPNSLGNAAGSTKPADGSTKPTDGSEGTDHRRDEDSDEPGSPLSGVAGAIGGILGSQAFQNFARSAGRTLGREITRSVFGTGRSKRRR